MNPKYSEQIEMLYLEMYDMMICYARCSIEEESLAEEAVQNTFQIACQKPDQLCESVNPKGWLVNTLKFAIRNMKRSRESARQLMSLMEQDESITYSEDGLPLQLMYEDVSDSEEFKLLVEMAIEGKSHLEMATARGISVNACKKRVQRAKETLQKKMKQGVTK
ncbi:MAG: sigma-70 family RNA polymerase sigma factor [Oscillospiraceae bacterium]|nr:sigma-70 family RNA polymerase sigma factor [Oscillospiraceae bacterium]